MMIRDQKSWSKWYGGLTREFKLVILRMSIRISNLHNTLDFVGNVHVGSHLNLNQKLGVCPGDVYFSMLLRRFRCKINMRTASLNENLIRKSDLKWNTQ